MVAALAAGFVYLAVTSFHGYNGHEVMAFIAIYRQEQKTRSLMKSVNIAELRNRLSVYINDVKAGEEILVRDRNQPVARIVPLARSRDENEELLALASQGKLRLGEGLLEESFWKMPAPRVPVAALRSALEQERDED
jgi:prevent-host-death family protein